MSNEVQALLLGAAIIASAATALLSKKVSTSLIALFYAAVLMGLTFTIYGDALLGLITMVTFAGAVSVLLLSVILITGESSLQLGARRLGSALASLTAVVGVASFYALFGEGGSPSSTDLSLDVVSFVWTIRPWDLLILMVVFAGSMISVVSLLGGED